MVKEAEENAEADKKKREAVDTRNHADSLINETEKNLKEHGDKVPEADKNKISTDIEELKKVKDGERIVCVGWIESYVKSIEEREYLFDLEAGAKGLLAKYGRSDELDLVYKSYSNLLILLGI